jgi:hypothetical protein
LVDKAAAQDDLTAVRFLEQIGIGKPEDDRNPCRMA